MANDYSKMSTEELNKLSAQNSAGWHAAGTQAAKDYLVSANQQIKAELDRRNGTTSTFDSGTGTWSTTPATATPSSAATTTKATTTATSYSSGGSGSSGSSYSTPATTTPKVTVPSTTGVRVNTADQQAIKDEMAQNSLAWHTATPEEQKQLEARNQYLGSVLGGTVGFDPGTGTWSGTAEMPIQQPKQTGGYYISSPSPVKATDYSSLITSFNNAAKDKAMAALKAAYDKNINAINAAVGQISPQYEDARNQAAGLAALNKRNWQETASATGLNSGAAGQAALAQNVALQNNLNSLNRAEAADLATLEAQRAQTESDYNNAIAQAEAEGNYELAQQLYQEKVRVDEANREAIALAFQQQLQAMQFNYGVSKDALNRQDTLDQFNWKKQVYDDETTYNREQDNYNKQLEYASTYAQNTGDYSMLVDLGIYTPEQATAMGKYWQENRALAIQETKAAIAAKLKTGSGGNTTPTKAMTLATAKELAKAGQFTDDVLTTLRNGGYTDETIRNLYGWTGGSTAAPTADYSAGREKGMAEIQKYANSPYTNEYKRNALADFFDQLLANGEIDITTQQELVDRAKSLYAN